MPNYSGEASNDCYKMMKDGQVVFDPNAYPGFIVAGIKPLEHFVLLPPIDEEAFFLEKREAGIVNIGGKGLLGADGAIYEMNPLDCTYLGKGTTDVKFFSEDDHDPALFLMISVAADFSYPNHLVTRLEASSIDPFNNGNENVLVYIRPDGIQSCQLQMGAGIGEAAGVLNEHALLSPSSPLLVYHLKGQQPTFIWAATNCD